VIYVVLGMHKSGTTLISQILDHSGINMGEHDTNVSYDDGNKYEREASLRLNEEILDCVGQESIDILPDKMPELTDEHRTRMREIIASCNANYETWGFKDPRTCLVYPLWASELPEHKLIVIFRSYKESWGRYRFKSLRNAPRQLTRAWKYLRAWTLNNSHIVQYLKDTDRDYLVLEYSRLMTTQEEFDRLLAFVGQPLEDKRRAGLYRNRASDSPTLQMAQRLIERQTGISPSNLLDELEALREANIRTSADVSAQMPPTA
jgi:hypothetical protein